MSSILTRIKSIFSQEERSTPVPLSTPASSWHSFFFGTSSEWSGKMDKETALSIAGVWASVRILSSTISSLQVDVYQEDEQGNIRKALNHPLHKIINRKPYPLYNSHQYHETSSMHEELTGNSISLIKRNGAGQVTGLQLIDPEYVTAYLYEDQVWYMVMMTGMGGEMINKTFTQDEVLHIKSMAYDGLWGKSPIAVCREAFEEAKHASSYSNNFYKKGAHLSGVISYEGNLNAEKLQALRDQFNKKYSGADNSFQTAFLDNNAKFTPISMSQKDADFILNRKMTVEQISSIFGVPLHMIASLDRATFNNVEHLAIEYVEHSIRPRIKRREAELNDKLFTEREKDEGYFIRYNIESLLRGDTGARVEKYRQLFNIGVLSPNDIRKFENMNPIPEGDRYYIPLNMQDPSDNNTDDGEE